VTVRDGDRRRRRQSDEGSHPGDGNRRETALGRREALVVVGTGLVGSLAGCSLRPSFSDADVIAGPGGRAVFEPAALTVAAGDTVTWGFASAGHNVCCRPDDSEEAGVPAGVEGFASYGPDGSPRGSLVPRGKTYEHTFDVVGQYDYVCVPHVVRDMVGTIRVE
jgi:plastocyanin